MKAAAFLENGGELGGYIREYDWSSTSLGSIETWPQSLLTTLSILLNSNFPMFLYWGEEHICFYNDAFRPSLGVTGKHPWAVGKRGEEVWGEIWNDIYPMIIDIMNGGKGSWNEDRLVPIYRNGKIQEVYWTYSSSPVKIELGTTGGVLVTCIETTNSVRNLQKLQESENLLRFAIEAAELATWDYCPKTNKFSGNETLKEWFGLPQDEEIELSNAIDAIDQKDKNRVVHAIQKALDFATGGSYDVEYSIVHPITKKQKVVRAKGKAWFDSEKVAYRFNGTIQDTTDQFLARKKIEDSENRLHLLVEESPIRIIFLTGPEMIVELANETVLHSWGKDKSIIGNRLCEVMPELVDQPYLKLLDEVYKTGKPLTQKGTFVQYSVNEIPNDYYFDLWYKPMFDTNGEVYGILSTAVDVTEKIIAQQRIEQSQRKLKSVVESAPFPIGVYVGREMRIQLLNKSIMDIWGKGYDLIGKTYAEALPELEGQEVYEQLQKVYDTGIAFHNKNAKIYLVINGKRKSFYFNYSFTPLFDADGKVYGVMNTAADVTELNLAKKRLEKSEQNLRNVILQAPVAMCIFKTSDFIVEIANEMMLEFWGRPAQEIIGKPIFEALPEAKNQGYEDLLNKVFSTGETHKAIELPVTLPREDKIETIYMDFVYEALRDDYGTITGVMAVVIDVTEQVVNRKEIEEAQEKARLAIESADLGPYEVNLVTNEVKTSKRFNAIWGIDGKITREKLIQYIHPEDLKIRQKAHAEALISGNLHYETRILQKDHSEQWIRIKGKVLFNEDQKPITILGVIQDITEQKRFAEELTKQVHERTIQLQRSNDDLLQFAHVASHDLKEPIRKIKIFTNMIESEYAQTIPEKGVNYLGKVQNAADRMFSMVEGVLAYSTINSAERPIQRVNLNTTLDDIETDLEVVITQKAATIKRDELPVIEGAEVLLYQLFYNLINNALKFSKSDVSPVIEISSSVIEKNKMQYLKITVADNGIGIDPEYSEKIFDAFTRLNAKDKYEGTGLGLALCKKIIERHDGTIVAKGTPNKGSIFIIELPVKQMKTSI